MIIEKFLGVPVMIQLKNPILGARSAEEVTLEDGTKCGSAMIAFYQSQEDPRQQQPVALQVLRGEIEEVDDSYIIVGTLGADNVTPIRCCVERENVASVVFCVEHHAPAEAPKIVTP